MTMLWTLEQTMLSFLPTDLKGSYSSAVLYVLKLWVLVTVLTVPSTDLDIFTSTRCEVPLFLSCGVK